MLKRLTHWLPIAGFVATMAFAAQASPLSDRTLDTWLRKYALAWEERDAAAAGKLFTEQAFYQEMPFDPPKLGRAAIEEYWRTVTADQRDIKVEYRVISVSGNTGVAHWSATFKLASSGATAALDGVFVLEFDASGHCKALREWWHFKSS
jgi:SnoaL-like domain